MIELPFEWVGGPELTGLAGDFMEAESADLLARWEHHEAFWNARLAAGLDPFFRLSVERVGPTSVVLSRGQERLSGINFAAQDYLSLASHPAVCAAAIEAIGRWGVHAGGPLALQGGTSPLLALEERLAEILSCREVTIFPTGWAAGYGAVRALVREDDHVVLDAAVRSSLREASASATRNLHRIPNCSLAAAAQRLASIREHDAHAGILFITESLFSMDSTAPDLKSLQQVCHEHQATLLVDASHDFGAMGDGGLGCIGEQGMTGEVDLIVGSFAPTLASNGGFVASSAVGIKQALRVFAGPLLFSNALSPVQASVVNAALDVARSREGAERRSRLTRNALRLREALMARAFRVLGQPSPIVPVSFGGIAEARLMTRATLCGGALVNLVEHPMVARQNSRWRLQVMTDHTDEQIDQFVTIAVAARESVHASPLSLRTHPIRTGKQT